MSTFRLPSISAQSETEQLQQIRRYLYDLTSELNWAFNSLPASQNASQVTTQGGKTVTETTDPVTTFNSLKALIIKSADIVNAYYEQINSRLEGLYVAESEFGAYAEKTSQEIQGNSSSITQLFSDLQTIISNVDSLEHAVIDVTAHIKSGVLYYDSDGAPVYGLEIGQRNEIDGVEVFNRYARFTSNKLSFYDQNGNEVAYFSDRKLFVTNVEITGSLKQGGFVDEVLADKSVVTKWVGGDS